VGLSFVFSLLHGISERSPKYIILVVSIILIALDCVSKQANFLKSSRKSTPSLPDITWKLPDNIEDHIEKGILKAGVGIVAGAAMGALFFKSGKGYVGAMALAGVGVAIGSTVERARNEKRD